MRTFTGPSLVLAFAVCALADYNTVITDLNNLGNALSLLENDTQAVAAGVAGVPFALQVEVDSVKLDDLLIAATRDANASAPFGEPGSLQVSGAVINLSAKIQQSLAAVAAKNTTFGELGPIVLSVLYQFKKDTDAFGKAVIAKLDPLEGLVAPAIIAQIDGYFNSAIEAYGGTPS